MSPILLPTQGQIDSILDSLGYFTNQGTVGYSVGVVTPGFEQIFFSGAMNDYSGNPLPFDEDVPFELASVSKVFPAALLTQLALKDPTLFSRSITSCVPAGFASLPSSFD